MQRPGKICLLEIFFYKEFVDDVSGLNGERKCRGHAQLSLGVRENLIQKCKESRERSRQEAGPADPGQ